jgi:hypothetical protein
MKKVIFSMALLTTLIFACKKSNDDDGSPASIIRGKWTPVSTKVMVYNNKTGASKTSYKPVYPGDYLDFRSDNKVYTYISDPAEGPGYDPHDTLPYQVLLPQPRLVMGEDTLSFGAYTKDSLVLYLQEHADTLDWQTTYTLKK